MHITRFRNLLLIAVMVFATALLAVVILSDNATAKDYDPEWFADITEMDGDPGERVRFYLDIENAGTQDDDVEITVDAVPSGWSITISPNQIKGLKSDNRETKTVTISVTSPDNASAKDSVDFNIIATSTKDPDTPPASASQIITYVVNQEFQVVLRPIDGEPTTQTIDPGTSISFKLNLLNSGNGDDRIAMTRVLPEGSTGWVVIFSANQINLEEDEETDITIQVTAPNSADAGQLPIDIIATSKDGSTTDMQTIIPDVNYKPDFVVLPLGDNQKTVKPKESVAYGASIENKGNDQDNFKISIKTGTWETEGWTATLDFTSITVSAGSTTDIQSLLTVNAPDGAADAEANIVVEFKDSTETLIKTLNTRTRILQQFKPVINIIGGTSKDVDPGEDVTFTVEVLNDGNGEDQIALTITNRDQAPGSWSSFSESSVILASKAKKNINLTVTPPSNALYLAEGYTLQIYALSEDEVTQSTTRTLRVNVNKEFGVSVTITGASTIKADPGQTVEYSVLVRNRGNVEDTILLTLFGEGTEWKPGWGSIVSAVDLQSLTTSTVTLTVNVPTDAGKDDYKIGVKGTSEDDTATPKASSSAEVIVSVNQIYGIIITIPASQKKVDVNSEVIYDIEIWNDGTGEDTITLAVTSQPQGWQVNFDSSTLLISAKNSKDVKMTVKTPFREEHRAFYINFTATSQEAPEESPVQKRGTVITTVNQTYEFNINPDPDFATTLPGKTVTFDIGFENKGTGNDRIKIERSGNYPEKWTVSIADQVTVNKDQTVNRLLTVSIDEETLKGEYQIQLTGTSMDDPKTPAFTRTTTITINVNQRYNLTVSIGTDTRSVNPFPVGQTHKTTFTFTVNNSGTGVDKFKFTAVFDPTPARMNGWSVEFAPQILDLGVKKSGTVNAIVTVPSRENIGTYGITLTTTSDGDPTVKRTIKIWVQVNQTYSFDMGSDFNTRLIVPAPVVGDLTDVDFKLTITNTGTGTDKFYLSLTGLPTGWFMNLPGNTGDILKDQNAQATLNLKVPGRQSPKTYNITVTAVSDGSDTVKKTIVLSVVVNELHALELSTTEPIKRGDVNAFTTFDVVVTNRGTGTATFTFDFVDVPPQLTVSFPSGTGTSPVQPTAQTTKLIRVFVEDKTSKDRFPFKITVTSDEDNSVKETITLTVDVNQSYSVRAALVGSPAGNKMNPGTTANYEWEVTNDGTGPDTISVEVPSSIEGESNIPPGWKVTPIPYNFELTAGQSRTIDLEVEVDRNAQPRTVVIVLYFKFHDDKEQLTRDITVIVNQTYNVATNLNYNLLQIFPGYSQTATLILKNTGTGIDFYRVEASTATGIIPEVGTSITDDIDPDATIEIPIIFSVDGGIQPKQVKFYINVTSQKAEEDGIVVRSTSTISIQVKETYGVAISQSEATFEISPTKDNPGVRIFTVAVTNEGSSKDTFNFDFANDNMTQKYKRWITLPPSLVDVAPGASQVVSIEISVPPWEVDTDAISDGSLKDVVFMVYSKGARDNNVEVVGTTTKNYLIHLNIREYFFAQFIAITPSTITMDVDDIAFLNVTLKNRGNSVTTFSFEKDGKLPDGRYTDWYDFLVTSREVALGQEVTVMIRIDPRSDAPVGIHDLRFHAEAGGVYETDIRSFRVDIEEKFGGEFVSSTPRTSDPGRQVTFQISVRNTGNSNNQFHMDDPQLPEGWDAPTWQGGASKSIAGDSSGTFELRLTIPTDYTKAPAGPYQFEVTGRYTDKGGAESNLPGSIMVDLNVNTIYGVAVTSDEYTGRKAKPGREVQYQVKIQNTGNKDETYQITILGPGTSGVLDGKDWVSVGGLTENRQVTIDIGETKFLPVSITIPMFTVDDDDAEKGVYGFRLKAESISDSAKSGELLFQFEVQELFSMRLWSDIPGKEETLKENDPTDMTFTLYVRNLGNTRDTLTVTVPTDEFSGDKRDWTARFGTQTSATVELNSLAQTSLVLNVKIDRNTQPGDYTLRVRVESQGDTAVFSFTTLYLNLSKAEYGLLLEKFPMATRRVNPADEAEIEFKFSLTNTGNQEDTYTIEVETPLTSGTYRDWIMEFQDKNGERRSKIVIPKDISTDLTLSRGSRVDITLIVMVDPKEEEGEFTEIAISASSDNDNTQLETLYFELNVVLPNLRVTNDPADFWIHPNRNIREGDDVDITVRIYNDGTAETGKFFVFFYNSRRESPTNREGDYIAVETVDNIPANSYYDVLTVWYDIPGGRNDIYVHADKPIETGVYRTFISNKFSADGLILESRENDNWATIDEQFRNAVDLRPDLTITNIEFDDRERKTTTSVTVTVANVGSAKAISNTAFVSLRIGNTALRGKVSKQVNPYITDDLDVNDDIEIEFTWEVPDEKKNFTVRANSDHPDDSNSDNDRMNTYVHTEDAAGGIAEGGDIMIFGLVGVLLLVVVIMLVMMMRMKKTGAEPAGPPGAPPKKGKGPKGKPGAKPGGPPGKPGGKPGGPPPKPGAKPGGPPPKPGEKPITPPAGGKPAGPPGKPGGPLPVPGGKPPAGARPAGPGSMKPCPKCKTPIPITSDKRPLKLVCPKCGASGMLNK